jgi:CRISPR-associated protein Csm3
MKWNSIVRLRFEIAVDGFRIGGSGGGLEIGGNVDANLSVIKNPANDEPYIPGSSLKGKLRSCLEKEAGKMSGAGTPCDCGSKTCTICVLFGAHPRRGRRDAPDSAPTRIVVRDAAMTEGSKKDWEHRIEEGRPLLEEKTENLVNRMSGTAQDPRTGERVLAGTRFGGEIVVHIYEGDDEEKFAKEIRHGLAIIQEASALGASGSRGSGKVRFEGLQRENIPLNSLTL